MADRDFQIPMGPDKTGGLGLEILNQEQAALAPENAYEEPAQTQASRISIPTIEQLPSQQASSAPEAEPVDAPQEVAPLPPEGEVEDGNRRIGGMTEEETVENGMDDMQRSILALKDSIGQGRELKAREREREELAEALEADHRELADRDNILANYQTLVAEQDGIIARATQERDARKDELARTTASIELTQNRLDQMREEFTVQLQPIESDLGRVRASADQAKNDERSRKSELNAAESELRRANEADANTMAVARHQQAETAYNEARQRSEQTKEQLAQVQKAYDDARQQADQAMAPLERNLEDLNKKADALKETINQLGEDITVARNRRQYCDTVYQYPDETAKMHREVEEAEEAARQMDAENDALRDQLVQSRQRAKKAKIAIGVLIVLVILIIVAFIVTGIHP